MSYLKTISQAEAEGKVAAIYERFSEVFGNVPNVVKMWSASPHFLYQQADYLKYYNEHPNLDPVFFTYIRLLVSVQEKGEYCIRLNTALLLHFGINIDEIKASCENINNVAMEPERKELLLFALKVTREPENVSKNEIERLREFGWEDYEIFDAVLHASNHASYTKLVKAFNIEIDF